MLFPNLEVTIQANWISIRNLGSGQIVSADAPFSCAHQLVDDASIFEHACHQLLKRAGTYWWSFPRTKVSIPGRPIHTIERRIVRELLQNAGAHQVTFHLNSLDCEEQRSAQEAYVEMESRKR